MITLLRRVFWIALLGGAAFAAWSWWQRQNEPAPPATPEWPPLDSPAPVGETHAFAAVPQPGDAGSIRRWVEPVDGGCPAGYPVKANDNSGIYHVPGGRFYERTVPERCYARAEDAEADGYRAAKS